MYKRQDPHQSIYGWRGASATTLAQFPRMFAPGDAHEPGAAPGLEPGAQVQHLSVSSVSYTHLDVYKRQRVVWGNCWMSLMA